MGLLKRNKEPTEVQWYHLWQPNTITVKFQESVELNSCWTQNGDLFTGKNDGSSVDGLDLGENFESKSYEVPSLLQIDGELIMVFKENSIVAVKDGFCTFKQADLVDTGLPENLFLEAEKEKKNRKWKRLGNMAKYTGAGIAAFGVGAYVGKKL